MVLDFQKIIHNDVLIAVVNLNYMFPVPVSEMTDLEYGKIEEYVDFKNDTAKSKYIDLLKREMKYIKELPLENNARSLYALKYDKPEHVISKRCFDFKTLEIYSLQDYWRSYFVRDYYVEMDFDDNIVRTEVFYLPERQ